MKDWPDFNDKGDLPPGIHQATLDEVIEHFGKATLQRRVMARRLEHIHTLVAKTGQVARFIIFGSFVTVKPDPGDVDIFLLMENTFDASQLSGETALLFNHIATQNYEGASIFWIRRLAALEGEEATVEYWQLKRDGARRGIVEVISND
ncbi:hypothetical protein FJZ31_29295 [Candidatus Poribacteria bacterium]|nr:hypothetical protein [Candidatus Poribacteria bacterium]